MKKILVTGGAGYIGSHTCVELIKAGYDIVVLDNLSNSCEVSLDRVEAITGTKIKFYKGDILDRDILNQIMETDFTEQYRKELMFNHFFDPENFDRYCEVLQHSVWVIHVNTKRDIMPFMTSDNPVLVEGIGKDETGLFLNGLGSPTTCIFYPLSPDIALGIYSRYGIMGIVADKYDGRKTMCGEMQFIVEKNVKIIAQAYNHAFIPQPLYDEFSSKKI